MMEYLPFFSIVIPTYNRADSISTAIQSVLNQSFGNFEIIIVDDGSTDDTRKVIHEFTDNRIVYIFQENQERSVARNNGIKNARGEFICFLDSDDVFLPNHLAVLEKFIIIQPNKVALFSTGMLRLNKEGVVTGHAMVYEEKIHPVNFIWKYFLLIDSVCVHREIFNHHLFDERFRIWEDTHLWLRVAAQYPFYQIPEYTTIQKVHTSSTVKTLFEKLTLKEIRQYIDAVEDLFTRYKDLISPYLSEKDKQRYILKKYTLFRNTAIRNRQFDIAYLVDLMQYRQNGKLVTLFSQLAKTSFRYLTNR